MKTTHAISDVRSCIRHGSLTAMEQEALAFVLPLSPDYPEIKQWFLTKAIPGIRSGSRHLVRMERQGRIAALGIAKAEGGESKICTVRVAPDMVGRGFGIRVFHDLMSWLGTDRPLATVSETKLNDLGRTFEYFGYRLTSVRTGLYVPGRAEYIFNEPSSPWGQAFAGPWPRPAVAGRPARRPVANEIRK